MTSDDYDPEPSRSWVPDVLRRRWFRIGAAAVVVAIAVMTPLLVQHIRQLEPRGQFNLIGQVESGTCLALTMEWAIRDLGPHHDAEVRSLIEILEGEPDRRVRRSAILALLLLGESALPAVPALLVVAGNDEDARLRRFAITVLAKRTEAADAVIPLLTGILTSDSDVFVIADAAMALRALDASAIDAVLPLARALQSSYSAERARAAVVLGLLGPASAEAVPQLANAIRDIDTVVRLAAINALGRLGAESWKAVPDLVDALEDENPEIRVVVARALGNIGPNALPAVPALVHMLESRRTWTPPSRPSGDRSSLRYLALPGDYCGPISVLGTSDMRSRRDLPTAPPIVAAEALGAIGAAAVDAIPALTEAAYDQRTDIRQAAGRALDTITGAR